MSSVNAQIDQWVKQQSQRSGLFAIGVCHADQSFMSYSCSAIYTSVFLNNTWRSLRETFELIRTQHQFDPLSLRWVFEHAYLYAAQRPDGSVLGIYVSRDEQLVPRNDIERILNDFLFLEPATLPMAA